MPTEVDVQARVIAGDGHQRPAGEEKEAEGARAAPARQKSAASAEWARRLEAEGDLQDRSVARSTAFAVGQRYFHGTLGRPSTRPLPPHHLLLRPDPPRRPRRQHHPCRHSTRTHPPPAHLGRRPGRPPPSPLPPSSTPTAVRRVQISTATAP